MEMTATLARRIIESPVAPTQVLQAFLPSGFLRWAGWNIESQTAVPTSNSIIVSQFLSECSSPTIIRVAPRKINVALAVTEPSVNQQVRLVLEYFGLSKSDLSKILGITRPTLYAWLEGHIEPKSENTKRLVALASLVERIPESQGYSLFHAYIERPVSGFPMALVKALAAPSLDPQLIKAMVAKIRTMTCDRNARIGRALPRGKLSGKAETQEERTLEENLLAIGSER